MAEDSTRFFEKAKTAIEKCEKKKETKLEVEFEHVLKSYFEWLGLPEIEGQYEENAGNIFVVSKKRKDATYGKVIIEYEPVGKLFSPAGKQHALSQIKDDYIGIYEPNERQKYVGIIFDGKTIIFLRWVEKQWDEDEREFDNQSFEMMVNYLVGLYKISFTELPTHFGFNNAKTREALKTLYEKTSNNDERAKMLFDEWNFRFKAIYGNSFKKEKIKKHFKDFAKIIGIEVVDEGRLIFAIHTYYAFIVKIIASEVAKNLFNVSTAQTHMKTLIESEDLKKGLKEIEDGKFFRDIGIDNFIEGTFLSWYIDVWDEDIKSITKDIIKRLDWFDFAEFITKPEYVVDYLKNFYQEVFPKNLRHDLGEYYTPDWLAKYVVNLSGFNGDIDKRVLDPACGSGTFLVAIINKVWEKHKKQPHKEQLIDEISKNIVGFDINPIAVLTARTNYLISLVRFNLEKTRVSIPVYLTDSIVLPQVSKQKRLGDKVILYDIATTKGAFSIPVEIKPRISEVMHLLKSNVEKEIDEAHTREQLAQQFGYSKEVIEHLLELYHRLVVLNKKKQNKIWCDIIINQFSTLFQGKFDFVIGNPPWVNWEFLDDDYQKHLMVLNDEYGLFFTKGLESRLGKVKRDISAIFFYVCSDMYLKTRGIIAFLIKPMYQIPSGKGFRNFNRLPEIKYEKLKIPLKLLAVEDVSKEDPFDIGNEVSLIVAKKGEETLYPITLKKWAGHKMHELEDYKAEPSDENDLLSTWTIYKGKREINTLGEFDYKVRTGVYHGFKEAFFDLELVVDKGKFVQIRNFKGQAKDIEKDMVYPLIMSRHVNKWKLADANNQKYTYCILPQTKPTEDNEMDMKTNQPKTWEWLDQFRDKLAQRKSKMFGKKPFYSIYGLGDWDSKYKVVWKSMGFYPDFLVISSVNDEILGEKLVLPEHVLQFIPIKSKKEAHYVCAILNSSIVRKQLQTLSSRSKSGLSAEIVGQIRLDKFDPENVFHDTLSKLSMQAHSFAESNNGDMLRKTETAINRIVEKLYKKPKKQVNHLHI
jgi:type I restriction-modification system DNA methylase subunit